jgi:chaperone required for assembly of F1-ATPase
MLHCKNNGGLRVRGIFHDIFQDGPRDPIAAARRAMRPPMRARFYKSVEVGEGAEGHEVRLDGRPVRTPARHALAAPVRGIADAVAAEWQAQRDTIDPSAMPLTRLANAIIDRVASALQPVREEIERYLGSDLICYRADNPSGLVERQTALWDPVLDWAAQALGARFVLSASVVHVPQPAAAVAAAAAAIPPNDQVWRLGALNVATTLTGSALIALAVAAGRLSVELAWAAAHVDEDWNMSFWGRDELALERRAFHFGEMQAAAKVLELTR